MSTPMDLTQAAELARRVRGLYHQLEEAKEGSPWGVKDDMLGLVNDVGTLSRLVMATEGRWAPGGDLDAQLKGKLAECLWWVLVLADRTGVDLAAAYASTMGDIEAHLEGSVERLGEPPSRP
jgi:NTP pyrophosphatase (non-canonical NTP hydrolase)